MVGRLPSGEATNGVCGYKGQRSRSATHTESKPSFSASSAILSIFSLETSLPI
ncbi:MAG: hypothetical protein ACTHKC_04305 [Candidatus Nitrosocosmicus sp.]